MKDEHVGDLIDLYALGALEPEEQAAVDRHLHDCAECHALLADSRRVVDLLAWSPEQRTPPPDLQRKVRQRIEQIQRARPAASPQRRRGFPAWTRSFFSPRNGLLAAALALALALAGWNLALQRQITAVTAQVQRSQQLISVLRGAGVQVVTLEPQPAAPNAWASMVINPAGTDAYLVADGLPQLPAGKAYQLWLVRGDNTRANGGLFRVDERGAATLPVRAPARLSTYVRCGITIEPESGSPGPTGPSVLRSQPWSSSGW